MDKEEKIRELTDQIASAMKELQGLLSQEDRTEIKVPGGVVRTVNELLSEYSFIGNSTIRRNVCYAIEALDFYRWIINRFNLYASVEGYLYKTGIILVNMIVEAIARDLLIQFNEEPGKKHSKNIPKLKKYGVDEKCCDALEKLRQRRSNIHLYLVSDLESQKYTLKDWNLSILCLRAFREVKKAIANREVPIPPIP